MDYKDRKCSNCAGYHICHITKSILDILHNKFQDMSKSIPSDCLENEKYQYGISSDSLDKIFEQIANNCCHYRNRWIEDKRDI